MKHATDVMGAIDSLLGTTSFRGGVVRSRDGVFTDTYGLGLDLSIDSLVPRSEDVDVDPCSPHRHGKLRGERRCHGCGRTRNEVLLDEIDR